MSVLWEAMFFIHGAFSNMNYLIFESRADVEGIHVLFFSLSIIFFFYKSTFYSDKIQLVKAT